MTQREEPRLALVTPHLEDERLWLAAPGTDSLEVDLPLDGERLKVAVWRYRGEAVCVGPEAAAWLSAFVGRPVRLVRCAPDMVRNANRHGATGRRQAMRPLRGDDSQSSDGEKGRGALSTLATFRRSRTGVLFGQNCAARSAGELVVGAQVEVLEEGGLAALPEEFRIRTQECARA